MALTEEVVYESGQPLTGTLMDYALPRADGVPAIHVTGIDSPSPLNPLGVKGTGEGSAVPGPAAIANAVADALGGDADLTRIPLRAEPSAPLSAEEADHHDQRLRPLYRLHRAGSGQHGLRPDTGSALDRAGPELPGSASAWEAPLRYGRALPGAP